jgi:serine protease AprX
MTVLRVLATRAAASIAVTLVLVPTAGAGTAPARPGPAPPVRVVVQASTAEAARAAVEAVGGEVTRALPIVDGVAAAMPAAGLFRLERSPGIRAVTPDAAMQVQGEPVAAPGPASVYREVVRADDLDARGHRGAGVTVALLDTGISPSPDLAGRVLPVTDPVTGQAAACENLSGESSCADGYGHGTFLAGLIAGNGASSSGAYAGVAPAADLVSIKVGASDGSADVSSVLAGIQWAVSFRDRYRIRVLNLSLGTDSEQSWRVDPLNYAVERAWAAGIVVVVSASNRGPARGTIAKPGDDPWVVTVGAIEDRGTPGLGDDRLPDFSGRGPTAEGVVKPDVVAPGAHLVSLRAVGSAIDTAFPSTVGGAYRRGSGTSMAAAVVSGVAAAVLSAQPGMTPDRFKYALTATARPTAEPSPAAVGSGLVDAYASALAAPPGVANQRLARSSGRGSLDGSRGTMQVSLDNPARTVLAGAETAQLLLWDPVGYTTGDWSAATWAVSPWSTTPWLRTAWYGIDWAGHNWEGCSRSGTHESDCFYGHNWEGSAWYGAWG